MSKIGIFPNEYLLIFVKVTGFFSVKILQSYEDIFIFLRVLILLFSKGNLIITFSIAAFLQKEKNLYLCNANDNFCKWTRIFPSL